MATSEDELLEFSDDDDFEFKPASINDSNCWGSNLINDLEITCPIKEVTSPVAENTNCVSELACVDLLKTEDSETKLNSESAASSSDVEIKTQLSISDSCTLISTEEHGETEPGSAVIVDLEPDLEAELSAEQNVIQKLDEVVVCDSVLESVERRRPGPKSKKANLDGPNTLSMADSGAECASELREDQNEVKHLDEAVVADTALESVERRRPGPKSKKLNNFENSNETKEKNEDSPNTTEQNEVKQLDETVAVDTEMERVERRRPGPKSKKNELEIDEITKESMETNLDNHNTSAMIDSGVQCVSESKEEVRELDEAVVADTALESVERRRPGPKSKKLKNCENSNETKEENIGSPNTTAMIDNDILCDPELRIEQNEVRQLDETVVVDTAVESVERRRPGPKSKTIKLENDEIANEPMETNLDTPNTSAMINSGVKGVREVIEVVRKLDVLADKASESVERRRPGPKSKSNKLENDVNANKPMETNADSPNTSAVINSGVKGLSELIEVVRKLDVLADTTLENVERRRPGPKSKTKLENSDNASELKETNLDSTNTLAMIDSDVKCVSESKEEVRELETVVADTALESIERRRPGPKSKTKLENVESAVKSSSELKEEPNEVITICDTGVEKVERRRPGPKSKTNAFNPNSSDGSIKDSSEPVHEKVHDVERRRPGPKSKTILENGENDAEPKKKKTHSSDSSVKSALTDKQKERSRSGPKSKTCTWKNDENDSSPKKRRKILSQEFIDDTDSDNSNAAGSSVMNSNKVKMEPNEFQQFSETVCDTLDESVERPRPGPKSKKKNLSINGEDAGEPKQKKKKLSNSKVGDETRVGSPCTPTMATNGFRGKGARSMVRDVEVPLQLGWKREIVHRATCSGNKRIADAYYTSPKGKKLRSMNEVEQYLHLTGDTSVKLEMFSYNKKVFTNHENESVRYAKKSEKRASAEDLPDETPKKLTINKPDKHFEATSTEVSPKHHKIEGKKRKKKTLSFNPSNNNNSDEDLNPACNTFCKGYIGQLPDMNCVSCFCLFHPKCVGIFSSDEASDFICPSCRHKQSGGAVSKNKSAESHHSNTSEKTKKTSHKTKEAHSSNVKQENKHTPSSSDGSLNKKLKTYDRSAKSSPSKVITLYPIRIDSPSSKATVSNLSPSRARVLPSTQSIPGVSEIVESGAEDVDPGANSAPSELGQNNNSNDYNCWTCTLPKEADALANVFNYLHSKDLFQMKLVCSSWYAVASRPFLWHHLYLQGLLVKDWNLMADFIEAKNVVMLNMRGMKTSQDIGDMWKQFNTILPRLSKVKELMLCKTPASIPYRLAVKLPHLTHFAAEEIYDTKVDQIKGCKLFMGKFNKLNELRRLKLNGFKGLFIPKSVISDEFLNTDALKNLKHLSLTSFAETKSSQLESLSLLPNLTILELGNCSDWTDEHFLRIGLLTKLKKLRLEYGGAKESPVLCEVLKKLTKLQTLELILFNIPENFIQVLTSLQYLQLLTVWPNGENGAANSYRLTKALQKMGRLKKFVWGLVASDLVREAAAQKKMDDKVLCIPYFAERNVGQGKVKWSEDRICANDLMERLRLILPNTIIRVVIVSSKSYSSIRQASANK